MEDKTTVEDLFPKDNVKTNQEFITGNDFEQIEIIATDEYGRVDAISIDYNEYRNELDSIYKITTYENSIISTYSVTDDLCNHTIIIRNVTGEESLRKEKTFNYDSNFIEGFLIPMVEDYNRKNLVFNSTVEIISDDKANFIARTKSNDSLILLGISVELANMFKDLVIRNNIDVNVIDNNRTNEKGIGNFMIIFLTLFAIGIISIGIVILLNVF